MLFIYIISFFLCFSTLQQVTDQGKSCTPPLALDLEYQNPFHLTQATEHFNHSANKDNWQPTIQRIFPTTLKQLFAGNYSGETTREPQKSKDSQYVSYANNRLIRLTGPCIVYPFQYFW